MPSSSRDSQRAAKQRFTTAEFLLSNRYNLDAMYLAGYAVECTLKALILEITPTVERFEMLKKISSGQKMHSSEVLGGILKDKGARSPWIWSSASGVLDGLRRFGMNLDAQ